ncbi:MAG: EamA family transporter [Anaerolineae bacterium]
MGSWLYIIISTIMSICAQLTLKYAMVGVAASTSTRPLILRIVLSPWVIFGMAVYGLGVLFWLVALSYLEVSYVYPFASLSYIGIIIGSHYLFKERIPPRRMMGIVVIVAGVALIGLSAAV